MHGMMGHPEAEVVSQEAMDWVQDLGRHGFKGEYAERFAEWLGNVAPQYMWDAVCLALGELFADWLAEGHLATAATLMQKVSKDSAAIVGIFGKYREQFDDWLVQEHEAGRV